MGIVTFSLEIYLLIFFVFLIVPYSLISLFFLIDLGFKIYLFIWSYYDLLIDLSEVYAIFIFLFLLLVSVLTPSILIQYVGHNSKNQASTDTPHYMTLTSTAISYHLNTKFLTILSN